MIFIYFHGMSHIPVVFFAISLPVNFTKHSVEHIEVRKPSKASTTISTYFNVT